ncbi:metal ABC transporter permease [Halomonas sp. MCCC 1A17488]|uniref:Metal ABC transporter permease n=1 Tax=Billgrantia sulfidoxydans TaxID=2733484 RepID=A0ABX7WCX8_9GAMM|nr:MULTISPECIES: metal ABC transporter permease [Halomonas]MCE8016948.1 metal ABC transporter permease [Halomonas sp. MCCC 1A17488]MCG3240281.1 metal ABC transporter permease [Halomonas sp. MCCC 1A17488]QPP51479.1 metal ABC transporter permease [Halomonas sp. SS10-MC5]QTP56938.1 metal ABC transporter permease [Halomonas sulfidoxydans]
MAFVNLLPESLAAPFEYRFMQRALLTSVLVGAICGLLSCYVVLKRWSLLGDAISHAVLPGVAIAYLLGWPFFIGAFVTGALTSLGIGAIERHTRIKSDAAMGLMFTAAFALGIVIISKIATSTHLLHILFGNVLGVKTSALLLTLLASAVTLLAIWLAYRPLLLYTFDPQQAQALGFRTSVIHYGLILLLTLTIVASLETVGIILVVAMLITPGATAHLLTDRFTTMLAISVAVGVTSAVVGLVVSVSLDVASGGAIVLVASGLFLLALLAAPRHGLVARHWRRWRLNRAQA